MGVSGRQWGKWGGRIGRGEELGRKAVMGVQKCLSPRACAVLKLPPGPVQAMLLGSLISGRWFLPAVLDAEEGLALLSERFQEEAGGLLVP